MSNEKWYQKPLVLHFQPPECLLLYLLTWQGTVLEMLSIMETHCEWLIELMMASYI